MTETVTLRQIAEKLGVSEEEIAERARRENWPVAGVLSSTTVSKGGRTLTVHSYKKTVREDKV